MHGTWSRVYNTIIEIQQHFSWQKDHRVARSEVQFVADADEGRVGGAAVTVHLGVYNARFRVVYPLSI